MHHIKYTLMKDKTEKKNLSIKNTLRSLLYYVHVLVHLRESVKDTMAGPYYMSIIQRFYCTQF